MNDPRFLPPKAGTKMRSAPASRGSGSHAPRPGNATQRGGFAVGLVIGLLIGLAVALGVALYITKAPIPFLNKVQQRTAGQDAAEAERNKNWDPNSPLYGKNPAKPSASGSTNGSTAASGSVAPGSPVVPPTLPPPVAADNAPSSRFSATTGSPAVPARDPAALLSDKPAAPPRTGATTSGTAGADPFTYFVQAGAYGRTEDAEQQRARLAMMGMEGRMSEREQSGRTVYRVRVGPFDSRTDADAAKDRLAAAGVEAALVRVQR